MRDGDKSGKTGRLVNPPMIEAHKTSIQDFDISPFDDHLIVTSDGGAMKLWKVPEGGLSETLRTPFGEVSGEACKRLSALNFHPTSENLLTTSGKDFSLRLFDINATTPVLSFKESHSDLILSTSWNLSGSLVATGCKDKMLRIGDPRAGKIIQCTEAHPGVKGFQATWLGNRDQIVTAGFTKNGERQLALWDFKSFEKPLHTLPIDTSPGMVTPYYDAATDMVFLLGRGDNTIRYYEVNDDEPFIHYLDQFRGTDSQSDITPFAKRLVDVTSCEVARFAKLTKDKIEHVMFQVPRKDTKDSMIFHEDLYKGIPNGKPTTSAQDWLKGAASKEMTILTPAELMPPGYRSIYDIDSTKKAEDERREEEKKAFRAMSIEERIAAKEASKRSSSSNSRIVSSANSDNEEDDDDDDAETLAKFSHRNSVSTNSSASSTAKTTPTASSAPTPTQASPLPIASIIAASSASSSPDNLLSPRQGKHKVSLDDGGSTYDGTYKNDQKHGDGVFTHKPDGSIYDGAWVDDKRAGKGILKTGTGAAAVTTQGTWIDNSLDLGTAVFTLEDGATFEFATFDSSGKIKTGKLKYKDGETYEGGFNASSGKRHGSGVWFGKDGGKYDGEYKDDLRHGKGEYHYPDGSLFKGNWKNDLPDGNGVFHDKSGKVITGTWSKGKLTTYTLA